VLRFTQASFIAIEQQTGLAFLELRNRLAVGSFIAIRALLWGGLIHADPKLAIADVAPLIDTKRFEEIGTALAKALAQALGDDQESEAGKELPASA
jgi:hypothetical protein